MTPEAQRIAIAEACGWKFSAVGRIQHWSDSHSVTSPVPPDYPNDLNAMNEATVILSSADKEKFIHQLMGVCRGQAEAAYGMAFADPFTSLWMGVFATAAQRAEAFLRTLGLWKDM